MNRAVGERHRSRDEEENPVVVVVGGGGGGSDGDGGGDDKHHQQQQRRPTSVFVYVCMSVQLPTNKRPLRLYP